MIHKEPNPLKPADATVRRTRREIPLTSQHLVWSEQETGGDWRSGEQEG